MIQRLCLIFFICFIFFGIPKTFAQQSTASKQVITFKIEAPQLQLIKKIWIYLPQNYSATKKKFPVIYMHDAQNIFDTKTSYSGEWNVDEKLDSLKAQVIIIGIEHGNDKRMDELTPYKNDKYGGGNAANYLDFIVSTLKPQIDKTYRTKVSKKNTAIMGSSLGGLVSYYALLKYPDIFGKAAIFSPAFWFNPEIYKLTKQTQKLKSKIYFLCGDNESTDMVSDLNKMNHLISEKRGDCLNLTKKVIVKGGQHNEKLWRDNFVKAYLWLF